MSFSFKLKSHVYKENPSKGGQLLVDHLNGVRKIALETNDMHGINEDISNIISIICMCHDFGKASTYFQKYLKNEYFGELKNHGEVSACLTYFLLPEKWKFIGFMCVKKHHGNMDPDRKFFSCNKDSIRKICIDIEKNIHEINKIYNKDLTAFFSAVKNGNIFKEISFEFVRKYKQFTLDEMIWTQYLWSLLLTADKSQLIKGTPYKNKINLKEDYISKYKNILRNNFIKKKPGIEENYLFKIRDKIYNDIIKSIKNIDLEDNHIFSINVPTGTGKTLGVYGGAFEMAKRIIEKSKGKVRPTIFYCLPFTSIIDQNYNVLENIIDVNNLNVHEDFILKHHSLTPIKYSEETKPDKVNKYYDYDARFCVENWQSTIITTTFVQLFNTLFKSGLNAFGNRFHKLAGSIIILDEVQVIPPKYFKIIENVFKILCSKFNTYVITVTATKPLLLEGTELVENNENYFKNLNRITIQNNCTKKLGIDELCSIILNDMNNNQSKSFLIVLNTIRSSLEVLNLLGTCNRKVFYLSTEIHPGRRLEIINLLKKYDKKNYVVISTQLIEAGVDLDFDIIYRDFSTIDSINQTSGRANRNGGKDKGLVKIYSLIDECNKDKQFASYIYPPSLLEATFNLLNEKNNIPEKDILELNKQYYKEVDIIKSNDTSDEIILNIKKINFKAVRDMFELIDPSYNKEDIIINYNEESQKCLDTLKNEQAGYLEVINAWKVLNKYKVAVDKKEMDYINCDTICGVNVLSKENYDENRGIKRNSVLFF